MELEWIVLNHPFFLCNKETLLPLWASSLPTHFYAAAWKIYVKWNTLWPSSESYSVISGIKATLFCQVFEVFHTPTMSPLRSHQPQPTPSTHCCPSPGCIQASSAPAGVRPPPPPSLHCPHPLDHRRSSSDVLSSDAPSPFNHNPCCAESFHL